MAFSSSTSTSTINNHPFQPARLQPPPSRSLRRPSATASTPNLNSVYAQTSTTHSTANNTRPAPSVLARKTSLATLTSSSLASIPDATESYAFDSVLTDTSRNMAPATPGRLAARSATGSVAVGDIVDVPGNMQGTVRFVGSVQGKNGVFAGVELDENFAARGKNNGDVDGVSYFSTMIPGAGIFLPVAKAVRRDSPGRPSWGSVPQTPTGTSGLRNGSQNSTNYTPPTPGLPKLFSASVGPGARAPSPQGKRPPRTSLPRPDSPVRRQQMTPGPRPSIATPAKTPARYGSPTNRFAQSVRGTAGDPAKKGSRLERMPSLGPRSASALGSASGMDDDATPTGRPPANGNFGSVSSYNNKMRPPSRTNGGNAANDDEVERLRAQLEERDRQFKEQAANLSEMEASLTELQSLMESSELSGQKGDLDDKDTRELKMIIKEKNEKIAMLTAEFDAHRADFRSTIDTLEMASTETERVYEKRIEELMAELRELESRNLDVDSVASQLKQLEELVQELEEGLEDARRGEAEARGEVEFLRGEVERTRTELRREREKANAPAHGGGAGDMATSKELEKKEDEIRGLKAIIHSLSRDSIPNQEDRTPTQTRGSLIMNGDSVENKIARDNLERQVAELQSIVEKKSGREEELERELESLRNGNSSNQRDSINLHRSSLRDSRDTVILSRAQEVRSPEATHKRAGGLASMPESDTYSTATENSTLWCEICETSGHDILTCTNMFGSEAAAAAAASKPSKSDHASLEASDAAPAPLSPAKNNNARPVSPAIKILPNPMESGPVAGKESGIMDPEKWCAVCERDGHDSVDCPFEDAF